MKIGILTFHRAVNYGAILQCFALQEVLKILKYEVSVIDYRQPNIEAAYSPLSIACIQRTITRPIGLFNYVMGLYSRVSRRKPFNSFVSHYLDTTKECNENIPSGFDIYMIGSDQVWNLRKPDPVYFGSFNRSPQSRVVGYAISSNLNSIKALDVDFLKRSVQNFSCLSIRERELAEVVADRTSTDVRVDIDPTLLADSSLWDRILNHDFKSRKYVLLYQVRGFSKKHNPLYMKAKELADKMGCEVIDLSDMTYSPEDFVSLFKYAQYVVTSSFHGTAFSLIFERPLYSVKLNDDKNGRYESLLNAIGAESMLVNLDFIPEVRDIDYEPIRARLGELRQGSIDYLKSLSS